MKVTKEEFRKMREARIKMAYDDGYKNGFEKGSEFMKELLLPQIPDVSLCGSCHCMTKTIDGKCGKCKLKKLESIHV